MTRAIAVAACMSAAGCGDDSSSASAEGGATSTSDGSASTPGTATDNGLVCTPNEVRCAVDMLSLDVCAQSGLEWLNEPCANFESCQDGVCMGPCNSEDELPSSAGCSFIANRMDSFRPEPDAIVIGNPGTTDTATVRLLQTPVGLRMEEQIGDDVMLAPGQTHIFIIDEQELGGFSRFRTGGSYRVTSDYPVVAYQHSPLDVTNSNESSMLLPEVALRTTYVVASYPPFQDNPDINAGDPSYFIVIATRDNTEVRWTPPVDTSGNSVPIKPVAAGETGLQLMNRGDTLKIGASALNADMAIDRDVSGTVVVGSEPIAVMGATECSFVPHDNEFCDHLQELMLPLDYWGRRYVGAASPVRDNERHYWRLYSHQENVTINTIPPQPGFPVTLAQRGDWVEVDFDTGVSVEFVGDKPFMPVQYVQGLGTSNMGDNLPGDPAMYQMVPVEQFLRRYAFVTGVGYVQDFVQVIRSAGSADVTVDGTVVTGYARVGSFDVADVLITEGSHVAESADPFGVIQVGYSPDVAYGYPGGMKFETISIP